MILPLNTYKEQIEKIYTPYKDIKYYTYNVTIDGNKLVSTVDINYAKIDTKKLIEIDSANSQLINDGKVKLSSVKVYMNNLVLLVNKLPLKKLILLIECELPIT